jgi:uncharacterized protein (DUF2236 family)
MMVGDSPVMSSPLEPVRTWIAGQIRTRVVGDDPEPAMAAVMSAPGDDRVIRRVHSDASMFVGGLRALLLQSLHPLAMAGVANHSDYRADPWGRLQRTADFLASTTFGPAAMAEESIARVRNVHRRVRGVAPDGRAYSAGDPHLLRWVHICEVDSFLAAYRRYGAGSLSADEADEYVADMARVAEALGVNHPPVTVAQVRAEFRDFRDELKGTKAARDAARFLLVQPPLPLAARPAYGLLASAAVALLPMSARWPLRLPYLPVSEAVLVAPAGAAVTRLIRWSLTPVSPAA